MNKEDKIAIISGEEYDHKLDELIQYMENHLAEFEKKLKDSLFEREMSVKDTVWDIYERNRDQARAVRKELDRFEGKYVRLDRTMAGLKNRVTKLISEYYSLIEEKNKLAKEVLRLTNLSSKQGTYKYD